MAIAAFEKFRIRLGLQVERVNKSCWLSHSWETWKVMHRPQIVRKFDDGTTGTIGHSIVQERRCERCGRVQQDVQKVFTV